MLYISCFSGIEAASVAVKKAGLSWEPVAFSEIEPFASAVLAHHYPQVPNLGDITKINWEKYAGTIGLVCGGSPCQAFSVAGLRRSLSDPRGNLTLEYMRAVHQIKPRWVVWEQVPGVMSASGNPLGCFMAGLAGYDSQITPPGGRWGNVGCLPAKNEQSYSIAYRILDAQHFGVPQRRRRIFLVGHIGTRDWWKPLEVLFERDSEGRDFAPGRKAGQKVAGNAGSGVEGVVTSKIVQHAIAFNWQSGGYCMIEPREEIANTVQRCQTQAVAFAQNTRDEVRLQGGDGQVVGALAAQPGMKQTTYLAFAQNQEGELRTSEVANTVTTTGNASARGTGNVLHGSIVRRITPTEEERLQGFPDSHTKIPYRNKPADLCPDGPRYKALGNSWAVPVAQWVFERIDKVDKLYNAQTV